MITGLDDNWIRKNAGGVPPAFLFGDVKRELNVLRIGGILDSR